MLFAVRDGQRSLRIQFYVVSQPYAKFAGRIGVGTNNRRSSSQL